MGHKVHEIEVTEDNALSAPMMECSQSGEFLCLVLPNGERLYAHRENSLAGLRELINNPDFVTMLERAADDAATGRGMALAAGQTPRDVYRGIAESDCFADMLEESADDFAQGRGVTLPAGTRPTRDTRPSC